MAVVLFSPHRKVPAARGAFYAIGLPSPVRRLLDKRCSIPQKQFAVSWNRRTLLFFVLTQFPRESAARFSRENRFTFFLELL
jgi:hypothetical protein